MQVQMDMKKATLLLCLLLFFGTSGYAQTNFINKVRLLYMEATKEKKACETLIRLLKSNNAKEKPLLLGYKGSATMIMARHVINPFTKLSHFKKGRNMLEKAIEADSDNVELRFLRYAVQTHAPSFLGYDRHIAGDKKFLLQASDSVDQTIKELIHSLLNKNKTD